MRKQPLRVAPEFRERVWGRRNLQPFFTETFEKPVGEAWFQCPGDPELLGTGADPRHPGICPLLVKLLFTSERLSVQVHPDDQYAERHHHSLGKTEAWYVIDSQPPGEVAVGFREAISPEKLNAAAQSGEIENLLAWRKVKAGDVIFAPAGTVHAIGAGLTICEIQENSDITYRLYDYGRARELHLQDGARVSHLGPHEFEPKPVAIAKRRDELLACEYFRIERLMPQHAVIVRAGSPHYLILINTTNGEVWFVPANNDEFVAHGGEWLVTYKSERPAAVTLT